MPGPLQPEKYGLLMDQLRSIRVQLGVTQETLAERLGKASVEAYGNVKHDFFFLLTQSFNAEIG
jgi:transcriptional regulator with XRE-family HTH domain